MKKKTALILAIIFSLGAFALTACTDKNKPRELDSVEKSIVGTWKSADSDAAFTFNSDGTVDHTNWAKTRQFKHIGYGVDGERGRYEIIDTEDGKSALFDIYPDRLYYIESGGIVSQQYYYERQ